MPWKRRRRLWPLRGTKRRKGKRGPGLLVAQFGVVHGLFGSLLLRLVQFLGIQWAKCKSVGQGWFVDVGVWSLPKPNYWHECCHLESRTWFEFISREKGKLGCAHLSSSTPSGCIYCSPLPLNQYRCFVLRRPLTFGIRWYEFGRLTPTYIALLFPPSELFDCSLSDKV